jgi:hypothetical protein
LTRANEARTKEIGDISGPFIETLFRVSCLEGGYVPGVVVKRDLFDCIDLKNAKKKKTPSTSGRSSPRTSESKSRAALTRISRKSDSKG